MGFVASASHARSLFITMVQVMSCGLFSTADLGHADRYIPLPRHLRVRPSWFEPMMPAFGGPPSIHEGALSPIPERSRSRGAPLSKECDGGAAQGPPHHSLPPAPPLPRPYQQGPSHPPGCAADHPGDRIVKQSLQPLAGGAAGQQAIVNLPSGPAPWPALPPPRRSHDLVSSSSLSSRVPQLRDRLARAAERVGKMN